MEKFIRRKIGPLKIYQAKNLLLYKDIKHIFTTRFGGVSEGYYGSLNLAKNVGDKIDNVNKNRKVVMDILNLGNLSLFTTNQIHSNRVIIIEEKDRNKGRQFFADALLTSRRNLPLTMFFADCIPIFIFDPENLVIGLVHAGWRGTLSGIVKATIKKLKESYKSNPKLIEVAIGPGIQDCCYEVGKDMELLVSTNFPQFNNKVLFRRNSHLYLSLSLLNYYQIKEFGIPDVHIAKADVCTFCKQEDFFSYRRDKGSTGRMMALIVLN